MVCEGETGEEREEGGWREKKARASLGGCIFLCGLLRGYVMQCIVDKFLSRHFESKPSLYLFRILRAQCGSSSRVREHNGTWFHQRYFFMGLNSREPPPPLPSITPTPQRHRGTIPDAFTSFRTYIIPLTPIRLPLFLVLIILSHPSSSHRPRVSPPTSSHVSFPAIPAQSM